MTAAVNLFASFKAWKNSNDKVCSNFAILPLHVTISRFGL